MYMAHIHLRYNYTSCSDDDPSSDDPSFSGDDHLSGGGECMSA